MSTLPAAVVAMVVLAAAGALPVLALVGRRWQALPLAPLAGAVVAAVAGACCLAVAGSVLTWFAALAALAAAGTVAWWLLRGRRTRPAATGPAMASGRSWSGRSWSGRSRTSGRSWSGRSSSHAGSMRPAMAWGRVAGVGALVVAGAVAWSLTPLRVPSTGWDARTIWLLRASWFADGHRAVLAAFRNPQLTLAHASYPPLVSAAVAVSWQLTGVHSDRLGVVVVALLGGCAVAAAAWVLVEAGRLAARRAGGRSRWAALPPAVGVVSAGLFVLAAFGVFGPFATNGYADPLWSAAAAGAIGYGLLLPAGRANLASAGILLAVAGLTKVEGTATAMAVVGLLALRAVLGAWSARSGPVAVTVGGGRATPGGAGRRDGRLAVARAVAGRPVLAGVAGIAALAAWTVLTRLEHTTPNVDTIGSRQADAASRLHLTVHAMAPYLHVLLLAVPLALVGGALLARRRRAAGLGNDLWAWAALAAGLLVVGAAYVTGPGNTALWLLASVHRTTMFPAVTAWLIVGAWAVVAATGRLPAAERHQP